MNKILKIEKTSYSKIAINEFLEEKENLNTIEQYKDLFIRLASVLFEIDSSESCDELNEKFTNGILFPVCTEEHKKKKGEDLFLDIKYKFGWQIDIDFDSNETIYTNHDVVNNLDKFKFL